MILASGLDELNEGCPLDCMKTFCHLFLLNSNQHFIGGREGGIILYSLFESSFLKLFNIYDGLGYSTQDTIYLLGMLPRNVYMRLKFKTALSEKM